MAWLACIMGGWLGGVERKTRASAWVSAAIAGESFDTNPVVTSISHFPNIERAYLARPVHIGLWGHLGL